MQMYNRSSVKGHGKVRTTYGIDDPQSDVVQYSEWLSAQRDWWYRPPTRRVDEEGWWTRERY